MDDGSARALEERFWLEGAGVYDELLDPACLMAFPGMGVMRAADVLDSLRQAPRWAGVTMVDRALGRADDDLLVLGYKAEGHRDDGGSLTTAFAPQRTIVSKAAGCSFNISRPWLSSCAGGSR